MSDKIIKSLKLNSLKKLIFYLLLFFSTCGLQSQVHLNEGFESGFLPAGWTKYRGTNDLGTTNDWTTNTPSNSGALAAYCSFENVSGGNAEDWLVTSLLNLSGTNNSLTFYMKQSYGSNYGSVYTIRISTSSQTDHASFTTIQTWNETDFTTSYSLQTIDLSAYDGQNVYIAFVMTNDDGDNWYVDDISVFAPINMSFNNASVTQDNTTWVSPGATSQEIIGIQISTSNSSNPLSLTDIQFNMNGSTSPLSDVSNINIYYTGTSSTFATGTVFGTCSPGSGTLTVSGSQTLSEGINYFWIAYDINAGATLDDLVDAVCTGLTINGGVGTVVPSNSDPTGSREIKVVNVYLMDNSPVSTCAGYFYDSGGLSSDYGLNEDFTKTFCSDNGDNIMVEFTSSELESSYDYIRVYDGPNTSSPYIGVISEFVPTGTFISSGTCLTFRFISDGFYSYAGWEAIVSCIERPVCNSNPLAADLCGNATYISNLDGYCGNTSSSYTIDNPGNLGGVFCGTIENNSWLIFTATSTSATFNVWVDDCAVGDGIQIQVYETSDCVTFNEVSNCWNPFYEMNGQVIASGLTPGNDYYIMIDGNDGDICDYMIGASNGVEVLLPIQLNAFEANCAQNDIEISWSTSSEINNDYFIVEKTSDGINFEQVAKVMGSGTSSVAQHYSVRDRSKSPSIIYYRLTQVDFNGMSNYSQLISLNCSDEFSIYPNPNQGIVFINVPLEMQRKDLTVTITDYKGKVVFQKPVINTNENQAFIDVHFLDNGVYNFIVETEKTRIQNKLIISK